MSNSNERVSITSVSEHNSIPLMFDLWLCPLIGLHEMSHNVLLDWETELSVDRNGGRVQQVVKEEAQRVGHKKDHFVVLDNLGFREELAVFGRCRSNVPRDLGSPFLDLDLGPCEDLCCRVTDMPPLESRTLLSLDWKSRKLLEVAMSIGMLRVDDMVVLPPGGLVIIIDLCYWPMTCYFLATVEVEQWTRN
jgi:hypothetical protein